MYSVLLVSKDINWYLLIYTTVFPLMSNYRTGGKSMTLQNTKKFPTEN